MADPEKSPPVLDPEVEKELPAPLAEAIRSGSVPENILKHSHDADEAMKAFQSHQGEVIEIDEATNKRLLRRIDWNLMPVMCVVYGLNYLDKTTISYASVMGIKKDIKLVGDDYQWLGSLFCESGTTEKEMLRTVY
jgi:MFS transporter, ACS family, allantoate permease